MMQTQETLDQLPDELRDVSQAGLVVMYYDEIIDNLRSAGDAAASGDIETRHNCVAAASELIAQLYVSLDLENGGEVAANLARIYDFILTRLPSISLDNDARLATQLADMLLPLRASWVELDEKIAAGEVPGVSHAPAFSGGTVDAKDEAPKANAA